MHIIIGIITAIAGLIWALNSLQNAGVDLNAFNPFTWIRRRRWEKQLGVKPMHGLTDSMDAAALLVVATAKASGDITRDTKIEILSLFENEFGIKRARSIELFSVCIHMIKDTMDIAPEVRHVLSPSKQDFQASHINKLISMMEKVANLEGEPTEKQTAIIEAVKQEFNTDKEVASRWQTK